MGEFSVSVGVSDGNGGPVQYVSAKVDTGATWAVLPDSLLRERLRIKPRGSPVTFTLADNSKVTLPVGDARFYVEDFESYSPVVFGPEGKYLLGATTLQTLGLIPDTTNERLIPAPEFSL